MCRTKKPKSNKLILVNKKPACSGFFVLGLTGFVSLPAELVAKIGNGCANSAAHHALLHSSRSCLQLFECALRCRFNLRWSGATDVIARRHRAFERQHRKHILLDHRAELF